MTESARYRILVADDHAVVRGGLKVLLKSQHWIEVCGEVSNGRNAVEFVQKNKPDLVILDLTMPEMGGFEAIPAIRQASPETEVLILTVHCSEEIAQGAMQLGARGYVVKSNVDAELIAAVQSVCQHKPYVTKQLQKRLFDCFANVDRNHGSKTERMFDSSLSSREIEVLKLLAEGKASKEVAFALGISVRTSEAHRNHIMQKMKFRSFSELVRFAVRNKLVEP
jgi:DNA-binding NarL/FixJ family response regulator